MDTQKHKEPPSEGVPASQPLLQQVQALRSLMPRAETLLGQVADYIRAAELTAAELEAGRQQLQAERGKLDADQAELTTQRDRLLAARSEFESTAERQEDELETLRSQLAEACGALSRSSAENHTTAEQLRSELAAARARVAELEQLSHPQQQDADATLGPTARRLELMEAELLRARSERGRMLAILGLTREESAGTKAAA